MNPSLGFMEEEEEEEEESQNVSSRIKTITISGVECP